MSGWRFALSRRWAGYLALTVVFAIVCCLLGMWQFARRAEARVEITKIETNYDSAPRPLDEVLPTVNSFDAAQKWTPITVEGTYLPKDQLLVRNRPFNGNPGFEVLTPLLLEDGTVFIVNRGWLPTGDAQDSPDSVPAPPSGTVTVEARLKPGEPTLPGRSAPAGQIATIQLDDIAAALGHPTFTGAYGVLATETPSVPTMPALAPKPVLDEGPHLSYALQWFVFALFGFLGFGYALRQEYRAVNADDPEERLRAEERQRKAAAKPRNDAEIEDAILDRQG